MNTHLSLSLRLGFSTKQAATIEELGVKKFIQKSITHSYNNESEHPLKKIDIDFETYKIYLKEYDSLTPENKKKYTKIPYTSFDSLRFAWLEHIFYSNFPLREKMTFFWHNHFVSAQNKVPLYFIHKQNLLFREHAFGNYKTLTKLVLNDEAMLFYLDNNSNKLGKINENLSRELLELFTLGIGNYTEKDIQEGARALCGLTATNNGVKYFPKQEDNTSKTYLNTTGNLKVNDLVDAIFNHPKIGYLLVEKLLKYFITDNPSEELIDRYARYFKQLDFEIEILLIKIFTDIDINKYLGAKIKDPLLYLFQTIHEFNFIKLPKSEVNGYLANQGLILFSPPNVKGWVGGRNWLNADKLLQRIKAIEYIVNRYRRAAKINDEFIQYKEIDFNKTTTENDAVIKEICNRLIYTIYPDLKEELESILTYDFYKDPTINLQPTLLRTYETIMKNSIYQLI